MALLALAAIALAYRDLLIEGFDVIRDTPVSTLVLIPGNDTLLVGIVIVGWLVWSRRRDFRSDKGSPSDGKRSAAYLAACIATLVWARIFQAPELLLGSLAAGLMAFAYQQAGRSGAQRMAFPAIALLLTLPIPAPIEGEIVWALQKSSAALISNLLEWVGAAQSLEGTTLRTGGVRFDFLEASSGLRLIQILFPISLAFAATYGLRHDRLALYLLLTTVLSFVLNILRILLQISSGSAASPSSILADPSTQTFASLVLGVCAYAALARSLRTPAERGDTNQEAATTPATSPQDPPPFRPVLIAAIAVAVVSLAARSPFEPAPSSVGGAHFPIQAQQWTGENRPLDYAFPYTTSRVAMTSRSYQPRSSETQKVLGSVEFFAGAEARGLGGVDRLPGDKLTRLGVDWHPVAEFRRRNDLLNASIRVTELARNAESEFTIVYSWRVRDSGLMIETLRALAGVDHVHWSDEAPRMVVRLSTASTSQLGSDRRRAMRRLDRFVTELREELEGL